MNGRPLRSRATPGAAHSGAVSPLHDDDTASIMVVSKRANDAGMNTYDPDTSPNAADWLRTDEGERIELVSSYHRRKKIRLPNDQLHAAIHVVVENQLALGEEVVGATLKRLQSEGLSRHEALHAIGSVLAEDLYELLREGSNAKDHAYGQYLERLKALSASTWRAG